MGSLKKSFGFMAFALLLGCGQSVPSNATPEECFAAMQKATEMRDFRTVLSCLAASDRNQHVGWAAFQVERQVFSPEKRDAATKLFAKHGLDKVDIVGHMQIVDGPIGRGVEKALEDVGALIKDQATFMKEASALLEPPSESPTPAESAARSKRVLSKVIIDGDRASATQKYPDLEEEPKPVFFKRENGSWVITYQP